jgi:hypothetical protein
VPSPSARLSLQRFLEANEIPFSVPRGALNLSNVELLYVAAHKDFDILVSTLPITLSYLSNQNISKISIIVPDNQVRTLEISLPRTQRTINVIPESRYVSDEIANILKSFFGERYGWVLQQILKILYVKSATVSGVLVIDADTALVAERQWIDNNCKQILTPTWEYHSAYYKFLEQYGIGENPPQYTFVPHHMLFQPHIMNEVLTNIGWTTPELLVQDLISSTKSDENSPFSIDYELYAQYLLSVYPEKVLLEKWSNLEARDRKFSESIVDYSRRVSSAAVGKYASVSFHSYLRVL